MLNDQDLNQFGMIGENRTDIQDSPLGYVPLGFGVERKEGNELKPLGNLG